MANLFTSIKAWFRGLVTPRQAADKPKKNVKFPKGTVIVCPKCEKELGTAMTDICHGESIRSSAWDGEFIQLNGPMVCPDDNTAYVARTTTGIQLHTAKGWIG